MTKFTLKALCGAKKNTRYISLFLLITIILSFTACEDKTMDMGINMRSLEAGNQIEFKTTPQTRSADNLLFDIGDTIGIYSVIWQPDNQTPGELQSSGNFDDNKPYNLVDENDNWTSPDPIYYPIDGTKIDLYAYYPWQENPMNSNAEINVSVHEDQRVLESYNRSDFKAAVSRGLNYESGPFLFDFYHRLSQVKFEIVAGTGVRPEQLTAAQIKLTNVITDGTYSFTGGNPDNITAGNTIADITPCGLFQLENNKVTGKAAIIIPQTLGIENQIEVIFANRTISAGFDQSVTFGMGESRLITITLNADGIDFTTEIKPWDEQPPTEEEDLIAYFDVNCESGNILYIYIGTSNDVVVDYGDGIIETVSSDHPYLDHTYDTANGNVFHVRIYGEKYAMDAFKQYDWENNVNIQGEVFLCGTMTTIFEANAKPRITSLDITNCPNLQYFTYYGDKNNKCPLKIFFPQNNTLTTMYIHDTEDLEIFPSANSLNLLEYLGLHDVGIVEIDVSDLSRLGDFNLSSNANLEQVILSSNIINLTLEKCTNLREIDITNTPGLRTINMVESGVERIIQNYNPGINWLMAYDSKLSTLDLSLWPNITIINVNRTFISELDFSNNPKIDDVHCKGAPINNSEEALLQMANSLPDRTNKTSGYLHIDSGSIPIIEAICNAKNWSVSNE